MTDPAPAPVARVGNDGPGSPPAVGRHSLQLGRMTSVLVALASVSTALLGAPTAVTTLWGSTSLPVVLAYGLLMLLPLAIGSCAAYSLVRGRSDAAPTVVDRARRALAVAFLGLFALLGIVTASGVGVPDVHHYTLTSSQTLLVNLLICVTTATPLVLGIRGRFVYVVAMTLLLELVALRLPDTPFHTQVLAPLVASGPCLMYLGAITWLLHQARNLDRASSRRLSQENATAQEQARNLGRRHINDFIHDHVLSALIPAATGLEAGPQLASTARRALDSLDGALTRSVPTDGEGLAAAIATQVGLLAPDAHVTSKVSESGEIPAPVARAAVDVVHEAVVNVLRHAGAGAACEVAVAWTPSGLRLEVVDDGAGFDTSRIPVGRHGIDHSIVGRMREAGGTARVISAPGRGTRVVAEWSPGPVGAAPSTPGRMALPGPTGRIGMRRRPRTERVLPWDARITTSMDSVGARSIGAAVALVTAAAAWGSRAAYTDVRPVLLAFVLSVVLGALLLWRWPGGEMPRWILVAFPLVVGGANALVLFSIPASGWPMYEAWSLGAGANLCCAVLMRERPLTAWTGIGALYLTTLAWVLHGHQPFLLSVTMLVGHAITVSLWWLAAVWSAWVSTSISAELDRHAHTMVRSHAQEAMAREMENRLAAVDVRARPVLERLASPGEPGGDLRLEARLLEAELRDEIRGAAFTGTPVVDAAREARARGVDVVLLDDTGAEGVSVEHWERVVDASCAALRSARTGRVTIRLLPPGRPTVATIATESGTTVIPASGDTPD